MEAEDTGFSSEARPGPAAPIGGPERPVSSHPHGSRTGFPWLAPRGLAWRLAATYLLTTSVTVLILSVAVYFATGVYLNERLEAELASQADFYAAYAANLARDEAALVGLAPTAVGLFAPQADLNVRFFAARDGSLLAATQDIGPQPSRATLRVLGYRSPTLFTPPSRDLPHRRYAARAITAGGPSDRRTIGVVEVSRSTLSSESFLATLRRILLGAFLVALALSLVVSVLVARRLSGPIRDMEEATRHIAAGELDVRLGHYPPRELARLADSINYMAERLKHLEAARAQFISEVAHELRTPLTAIKGLLVNLIDSPGPGGGSTLEIADRETDRLIRLVNQLLDFSRWQAGGLALNRASVDVGALARAAATLSEGRASHRGVTLKRDIRPDLPTVSADPDRLQQVILNLLDNAIKFTPSGGQVTLTAGSCEAGVEVSVQDTGRGMSDDEQAKVFEAYYRGAGGGTGLGLTVARAIVDAHGGQIGLESDSGRGSRVWFRLPV